MQADVALVKNLQSARGQSPPNDGPESKRLDTAVGGYAKAANFIDADGFVLTDGTGGLPVQYNLGHPPSGGEAGFAPRSADAVATEELVYACFRCHTTGAKSLSSSDGRRQDNLPGVGGTWVAEGVQCEACHGPGSLHLPHPEADTLVVDASSTLCGQCHVHPDRPGELVADDGFIVGNQQLRELEAGAHAGFACTVCHDPHASVLFDRDNAVRNACRDCHVEDNMAQHDGRVFVQGDYVEVLSCESCHMPPASRNAVSTVDEQTGGRTGDTRTHIVYIDTRERDFVSLFAADGTSVVTDATGKAAVTLDFVCLRCHNGLGSAFELALPAVSVIADGIHGQP